MNELRLEGAHRSGGEGPPLVLLHGITVSWRIWTPVLEPLGAHHRLFAPSLPGHAGAAALAGGVEASIGTLADALERQLDAEGIDSAHVVGNSLGGWLALELAARGRAHSVVAISPAGAWAGAREKRRLLRMFRGYAFAAANAPALLAAPARRPRSRRLALRNVMEHGDRVPARLAAEQTQEAIACVVLPGMTSWIDGQETFAARPEPFDVPVRIAWGEHDRTLPFARYGQPMVDALPGAELVHLPGVGHVPMYDDPELVVRTILEVTRPEAVGASRASDVGSSSA